MSWTEYTKIDTIAKRDLEGNKRLIDGTFRDPAVEYLKDVKWEATEKADGCLYAKTPILLADGTERKIIDIVMNDEQFTDGRTVGHRLHRCTVAKIFSGSGKIESRDTRMELREIDTGMVVPYASAEDVYQYDRASWNLSFGTGRPDDSCAEKRGDAEG